jgi:hypothetical protein
MAAKPFGHVVGPRNVGVAVDLKSPAIVIRQQRNGERRASMFAEIGRNVSDAQPAVGIGAIGVDLYESFLRLGVLLVPPRAFFVECP